MAGGKKNRRGTGASSPKRKKNDSTPTRKSARTARAASASEAGPKTTGEEPEALPPLLNLQRRQRRLGSRIVTTIAPPHLRNIVN